MNNPKLSKIIIEENHYKNDPEINLSFQRIPEELAEKIADNIYLKMKDRIAAVTKARRGYKYERGYLGKKNCRYEIALFDREISISQRRHGGMFHTKMLDVFPADNDFILYYEKNIETAFLYYKNIESLNSIFNLAVQKLNANGFRSEYHINNNKLTFLAIIPCNHYGIVVK